MGIPEWLVISKDVLSMPVERLKDSFDQYQYQVFRNGCNK